MTKVGTFPTLAMMFASKLEIGSNDPGVLNRGFRAAGPRDWRSRIPGRRPALGTGSCRSQRPDRCRRQEVARKQRHMGRELVE
jgi:hypothetical protein